jgi:CheY-like chemotaxis protein
MSSKRALIVDDSKSARAFLARILSKYEIEVDTAESAEQAIEFLRTGRPDVIFMDHLMPGMDGFQAVQLIKNNPRTATIPIMMYTSQEGELYVGQARALGAIGVLPKQIQPADVSKVLYQLKLIPDRRNEEQRTFTPANVPPGAAVTPPPPEAAKPPAPVAPVVPPEWRTMIDTIVRERVGDLRRELAVHLDDQNTRLLADIRTTLQEMARHEPEPPPPPPPAPAPKPWGWVAAAAAALIAIAFGVLWIRASDAAAIARQQASVADAEVSRLSADLAAERAEAEAARALLLPATQGAAEAEGGNQIGDNAVVIARAPVPYGEVPLAGDRLPAMRNALSRLAEQQFTGIVEVRTYPGRFCLVGNPTDGYSLAPDETPYAKCDVVGNPAFDGLRPSQRESLAFANLIAENRRASGGAIDIRVAQGSSEEAVAQYPVPGDRVTAGDWNRAGSLNNRVEIRAFAAR